MYPIKTVVGKIELGIDKISFDPAFGEEAICFPKHDQTECYAKKNYRCYIYRFKEGFQD